MTNATVRAAATGLPSFNRRALVAGATLVAAAALRNCSAPAVADTTPDADLVRLGDEFDRAHAAWLPRWQEWRRLDDEWRATLKARGMSFHTHGDAAVWAVQSEVGAEAASDANDLALSEVERVADEIRLLRPTTIAGIAAKAKVACFDAVSMHQLVKPENKRDLGPRAILALLAEIEALARTSA